ncbi:CAP domain-containing protein [Tissierella creatinophila]|uniref:Cysteine-rich secretory protein family protein n=1 Tax=Tissierella creatinophila DSM 6911 TaxID=1123403 RepID=A0A1U7M6X0_TISCR|nr:CAP domain-containing protein [Tissierella creatinophila]OLS03026.1 cysteine-rich secretory protein family protein [Tissierella creatinophila DSM 6911]
MLKRFKVLFLSLGIIMLGSNVASASNYNYNKFTNYKVDSNFYDTYTNRDYNYSWNVNIWNKPGTIVKPNVPSVPVKPKPEMPKPEVPSVPEIPKPVEPKPEVPSKPETPKPEVPSTETGLSQMEAEVVRLVNIERQKNSLSAFTPSNKLSNVARLKSQDMAEGNYFSHQSPKYGSPFDMMKSFGISYKTAGENIAKGYNSAESVVKGWMNSQGHRENILNSSFNTIGVGSFTSSNGTIYWTQMFTN